MNTSWFCLIIKSPPAKRELITAILFANRCLGTEDLASDAGVVRIKAFFDTENDAEHIVDKLNSYGISGIERTILPFTDWNLNWRKSMKPVQVSPGFWVKPSWSTFLPEKNQTVLVIDPKMSFGSGHHESTRICASLMEKVDIKDKSLVDIGTGTGILAMIAVKLGACKVTAFDIDPCVAENVLENFKRNNILGINFFVGETRSVKPHISFDIIVFNLIRKRAFSVINEIVSLLTPTGLLICSGFLVKEKDLVIKRFSEAGLKFMYDTYENEWWGAVFGLYTTRV